VTGAVIGAKNERRVVHYYRIVVDNSRVVRLDIRRQNVL